MKGILKNRHDYADVSCASYIWFGRMPADWYIWFVVIVAFEFGRMPADLYIAFVVIVAFGHMPADWYIWFAVIVAFAGWLCTLTSA